METKEIGLDYEAELEGGVVDGRKLAAHLAVDAFRLLLPYAKGCTACAWEMFMTVSEKAVNAGKREWEGSDKSPAIRFWDKDVNDREAAFTAHMVRTQDLTHKLIKGACDHS